MIPARYLTAEEVAGILAMPIKTFYNRLEARENGNRWNLTQRALRSVPPMQRSGRRWVAWGPSLEQWIAKRERGLV